MTPVPDSPRTAGLRIRIRDQSGNPVQLESGSLEYYHFARAAEIHRVSFPAGAEANLDLGQCFEAPGKWQLELDVVDAKGNRFLDSRVIDVVWVAEGS